MLRARCHCYMPRRAVIAGQCLYSGCAPKNDALAKAEAGNTGHSNNNNRQPAVWRGRLRRCKKKKAAHAYRRMTTTTTTTGRAVRRSLSFSLILPAHPVERRIKKKEKKKTSTLCIVVCILYGKFISLYGWCIYEYTTQCTLYFMNE